MSTRNIVARANEEGNIGTSLKKWLKGWFKDLYISNNLTDGTNNISVLQSYKAYTKKLPYNYYTVGCTDCNFTSLKDAIDWLDVNMIADSCILLDSGHNPFTDTITIDLPYYLSIIGAGIDNTVLDATTGLTNKPFFILNSPVFFNAFAIDGSTLVDYGTLTTESGIILDTLNYSEFENIGIYNCYNGFKEINSSEIWLFNSTIEDCTNGILVDSAISGGRLQISESSFTNNIKGIYLLQGTNRKLSLELCAIDHSSSEVFIDYVPATYNYSEFIIKNNIFNNIGTFFSGADFSRADGRDANIFIVGNINYSDKNPKASISLIANATVTPLALNTWTKAVFTNTSFSTTKFKVENNKLTFLPTSTRNLLIFISGTIELDSGAPEELAVCIRQNNTTNYGEISLRVATNDVPNVFGISVYIENVVKNDYFEIFVKDVTNTDDARLTDVTFTINAQ